VAEPLPAASLAALQPVLALFAQALAGHPVALRDGGPSAATTRGAPGASTAAITLPSRIDCFASERDNRAAYRIAVMRQAHANVGDESLQAAWSDASRSWRRVFGALECLRIDAAISRSYPGARVDLARQRALELAHRHQAPRQRRPLTRALDLLWRHALGDSAPAAAADVQTVQPMLRDVDALSAAGAGALDSARVATRVCAALGLRVMARHRAHLAAASGSPPAALTTPEPKPSDRADPVATHSAPDEGATFAPGVANDPAGPGAATAHHALRRSAAPSTASHASATTARTPTQTTPGDAATTPEPPHDDEPPGHAHPIDEWDYRQQRLLPHWCTLIERRQQGSDRAFIHGVRRRHAELARRVRRQFAAWRPEGLQRVHGASDGDEVELDRVIEARVDRRAGLLDDRAWYVRRDRAQRDVATAFLVDTSASTDFVLPDPTVGPPRPAPSVQADAVYLYDLALSAPPPEPPKRRVIDVAKESLALMCDALHTLGDCFAVYTFSGHGRRQVDFRIVKAFDEAVSSRTAGALAALRPHGATRTGAAIRHATAQLVRQSQRRRALIVVTDGYPEDIDYGPEPRDLRYGVEDTAHALREAQALGVHTFCLSIDPAGHDYLRRMCPPQRYGVIKDLAALPGELAKVYQAMTRASHEA
jgi:hypothetical protein